MCGRLIKEAGDAGLAVYKYSFRKLEKRGKMKEMNLVTEKECL